MKKSFIITILAVVFRILTVFSLGMIVLVFLMSAPMALPQQSFTKYLNYFLPIISGFVILGIYSILARKGIFHKREYGIWFSVSAILGLYISIVKFYFLRFYFFTDYFVFSLLTLFFIAILIIIFSALLVFFLLKFGNS